MPINLGIKPSILKPLLAAQSVSELRSVLLDMTNAIKNNDRLGQYASMVADYYDVTRLKHLIFCDEQVTAGTIRNLILFSIHTNFSSILNKLGRFRSDGVLGMTFDQWKKDIIDATESMCVQNSEDVMPGDLSASQIKHTSGGMFVGADACYSYSAFMRFVYIPPNKKRIRKAKNDDSASKQKKAATATKRGEPKNPTRRLKFIKDEVGTITIMPEPAQETNSAIDSFPYENRMNYPTVSLLLDNQIVSTINVMKWDQSQFQLVVENSELIVSAMPYLCKKYITLSEFLRAGDKHQLLNLLSDREFLFEIGAYTNEEIVAMAPAKVNSIKAYMYEYTAATIKSLLRSKQVPNKIFLARQNQDIVRRVVRCYRLGILELIPFIFLDFLSAAQWRVLHKIINNPQMLNLLKMGKLGSAAQFTDINTDDCEFCIVMCSNKYIYNTILSGEWEVYDILNKYHDNQFTLHLIINRHRGESEYLPYLLMKAFSKGFVNSEQLGTFSRKQLTPHFLNTVQIVSTSYETAYLIENGFLGIEEAFYASQAVAIKRAELLSAEPRLLSLIENSVFGVDFLSSRITVDDVRVFADRLTPEVQNALLNLSLRSEFGIDEQGCCAAWVYYMEEEEYVGFRDACMQNDLAMQRSWLKKTVSRLYDTDNTCSKDPTLLLNKYNRRIGADKKKKITANDGAVTRRKVAVNKDPTLPLNKHNKKSSAGKKRKITADDGAGKRRKVAASGDVSLPSDVLQKCIIALPVGFSVVESGGLTEENQQPEYDLLSVEENQQPEYDLLSVEESQQPEYDVSSAEESQQPECDVSSAEESQQPEYDVSSAEESQQPGCSLSSFDAFLQNSKPSNDLIATLPAKSATNSVATPVINPVTQLPTSQFTSPDSIWDEVRNWSYAESEYPLTQLEEVVDECLLSDTYDYAV